jgi:predicted transcriptional regulator
MEGSIHYVENLDEFKGIINDMLGDENDNRIMIAGTFDNEVYKEIVEKVLTSGNTKNSRIVIPMVGKNGLVSRNYINKICSSGGQIKINSKYKNNIIVIGEYVFIMSFSSKYSSDGGIKVVFECCVVTNERITVEKICSRFNEIWNHSLPLVQN